MRDAAMGAPPLTPAPEVTGQAAVSTTYRPQVIVIPPPRVGLVPSRLAGTDLVPRRYSFYVLPVSTRIRDIAEIGSHFQETGGGLVSPRKAAAQALDPEEHSVRGDAAG